MPTENEIIIKDACVLFDLIDLGLMEQFYALPITVYTTTQVIGEIEDDEQKMIVQGYIDNQSLLVDGEGDLEAIEAITFVNTGLSFADSSVLELALRKEGSVLSSDGRLRLTSARNNLVVRGILWVIKELVDGAIISRQEAIEKLTLYPQINDRTPKVEIKDLIKALQAEIENNYPKP